jgi:DNA polymerase III delta prime subunit
MLEKRARICEKAKESLVNPLSTIAMGKGNSFDRRTTDLAIKILAAISEGEYRYKLLLSIYEALIKNKSQSSRTAIDSLIGNHPERQAEIRQKLLETFKGASEEGRDLIKGHLIVI